MTLNCGEMQVEVYAGDVITAVLSRASLERTILANSGSNRELFLQLLLRSHILSNCK